VFCQLERLRRCFPPSIPRILDELPTTLDGTYERTLLEIPEEKWKHAHRLLQCLVVSFRPLRIEELAEVLAIRFESEATPDLIKGWRSEDREDAVLSACSSLIAVVEVDDSPVVQFSHFSVKEFLTWDRLSSLAQSRISRYYIPLEPAHEILARACLVTLLQLDEHIDKNGLKNYPLCFYAAQYWFKHTRFGDVSPSFYDSMGQLFDSSKPHFSAWIWIHDVSQGRRMRSIEDLDERPSQPKKTPLYYSAACGLRKLAERLIAIHLHDVNPPDDRHLGPLNVAVIEEHLDVARLLLEHGADPNRIFVSWTLLHHVSYNGKSDVIQLLLDHGANVDCISTDFDETPLHLASESGHVKAMQQLLEYGADVNFRRDDCCTPLHRASREGSHEGVSLLVRHGANVNDKDNNGWTPLHLVVLFSGDLETTRALLECGADVQATTHQLTPFQLASRGGHNDVAQLLLEYCAVPS
jgi:ankyrin repeat protein